MKLDFFIDRPVFSTVLSTVIVIVGIVGLVLLPVDQYPQIVPPVVKVSASYPGANAQTVTQAVATPIEQELNGTPGMIYMESSSSNSGSFSATVTFDISTDPDLAAVDIQNRLKQAESRLPAEVVQNGISVEKQASSKLMTITLLSSDPKFDEIYLSNYATLNVLDMLRRIPGVGSVSNVGSRYYAMQIWVQPDKLANLGLTVSDLQAALKDQNRESAAGVLGQAPMEGVDITIPITAQGRLSSVSQVRGDRNPGESGRLDHPVARRSAYLARSLVLQYRKRHKRRERRRTEHQHAAGSERHAGRRIGPGDDGRDQPEFSRGHLLQHPVRHDHVYFGVDPSRLPHVVRGPVAGDSGRLPLSAKLARNDHSRCGRADLSDRHLRRDDAFRVLAEYADAAGIDSGHRHRGGRRHRGGGERGPHHARRAPSRARSDKKSDERIWEERLSPCRWYSAPFSCQ